MIKLNEKFSFERDNYGWKLHIKHITKKRDGDGSGERDVTYFYANIEQMARRIVLEASDIDGNIDDLINAWYGAVAELKNYMGTKVDA